jgi:hypothetical protein
VCALEIVRVNQTFPLFKAIRKLAIFVTKLRFPALRKIDLIRFQIPVSDAIGCAFKDQRESLVALCFCAFAAHYRCCLSEWVVAVELLPLCDILLASWGHSPDFVTRLPMHVFNTMKMRLILTSQLERVREVTNK